MTTPVKKTEKEIPSIYPQEPRIVPALRLGAGVGALSDQYINAIGPLFELDGGFRYQHGQVHLGGSLFGSMQFLNAPLYFEKDSLNVKTFGGRFEVGSYLKSMNLTFHNFFSIGYSLYGASQRQLLGQPSIQVPASGALRFEQGMGLCFLKDVFCVDLSLISDTFSKPRIKNPPENPSVSPDNVWGWQLKIGSDVLRY